MQLSKNATLVLEKRYLGKDKDGNVIETPEQMIQRVARTIAGAERDSSMAEYEERFFKIMSNLEFLPNSPTLINAGRELGQLSACFVLPIEDNMGSIFTTLRDAALIQQTGGGTGFSFSNLRPKGDYVRTTQKCAGGPVEFIKVFDRAMEPIKQGGVRHGANIAVLRVDHPDIIEFITCKDIEGIIPNFNISVGMTDDFMNAVKNNREHQLINPRDGKITRTILANTLFDLIIEHAWQNGEPGLIFLDEINRHNMTPHAGLIEACNPCGEQMLLGYESCNLGSINLGRFIKAEKIDWDRLEYVTDLAIRFLDNVIDMNRYPISQIETKTKASRKVGLGVMGFADMLIKLNIEYDTDEALKYAYDIIRFIKLTAIKASVKLADERGVFPLYRGSRWHTEEGIRLRNSALTTVAPTGTLSIIANCSSGIEPYFSKSTKKHVLDTILDHEIEFAKEDCFITAHDIASEWHIKIQAAFQKFVCSAVSKTINFSNEATKEDIKKAYLMAYKLKCKGITVYRDGSRKKQVLTKKEPILIDEKYETCPECGGGVIHEDGCVKCGDATCGWSACTIG